MISERIIRTKARLDARQAEKRLRYQTAVIDGKRVPAMYYCKPCDAPGDVVTGACPLCGDDHLPIVRQ